MRTLGVTFLFTFCFYFLGFAQDKQESLTFKFSGFLRGDFYYDTRQSVAANEALFFLYPLDVEKDAVGEDLNAVPNSGFYTFNTRPILEVSGLKIFDARVSAKVEADFAGFSGASALLRLRQAYMKMQWEKASLIVGQTWHPLFSPVMPEVLSLSVGAPFNPFNRSPQIRYDYKVNNVTFSGAALYQLQYNSTGPNGKTNIYQRNAVIPELFLGATYRLQSWTAGVGIDYLTIAPRTKSEINGKVYKVDETLSSLSYSAYCGYTHNMLSIGVKSIIGHNLAHNCMFGGYGISSIDPVTGEQQYTNFTHSSSWLNISYGKKYKGNLFAGYTKKLGTEKALVENSHFYGEGLTMDYLYRLCGAFSYNVRHFSLGLEYECTTAGYGDKGTMNWDNGTYNSTHAVTNHRIVGVACYYF